MKYIIADPNEQSRVELKNILKCYTWLVFQGDYLALESPPQEIPTAPPDIAFIRIGKAEQNAFSFVGIIREQNPFSKVVFFSDEGTYAIDAFEHEADGFLRTPFNKKQIDNTLQRLLKKAKTEKIIQDEPDRSVPGRKQ